MTTRTVIETMGIVILVFVLLSAIVYVLLGISSWYLMKYWD